MDSRPVTAWCFESDAQRVSHFFVERTTVVHAFQLVFTAPTSAAVGPSPSASSVGGAGEDSPIYYILIRMVPHPSRVSGDNVYNSTPALVLSTFRLPSSVCSSDGPIPLQGFPQRWRIEGGTTVMIGLASAQTFHEVRTHLETTVPSHSPTLSTTAVPSPTTSPTLPEGVSPFPYSLSLRLHGKHIGVPFSFSGNCLRPLLVHRWYELKPSVRCGTVTGTSPAKKGKSKSRKVKSTVDVKQLGEHSRGSEQPWEAVALSANSRFIHWSDGSVGLRSEVKEYNHLFVRLAPTDHNFQHADTAQELSASPVYERASSQSAVVGSVPTGCVVLALGAETEVNTLNRYALIYELPAPCFAQGGSSSATAALPQRALATEEPGKQLWGWIKISNDEGDLAVWQDVSEFSVQHGDRLRRTELVSGSRVSSSSPFSSTPHLFTVVNASRGVRIRSAPSLTSTVTGIVEPNEVLEAAEWIEVESGGKPHDDATTAFVRWVKGGYSLVQRDGTVFLRALTFTSH